MTIHRKENLLRHHALVRLQLSHAAFVDSYEFHGRNNKMPVNRLLFICGNNTRERSVIHDVNNGQQLPIQHGHVYFIPYNYLINLDLAAHLPFVSIQFSQDFPSGVDVFESYPRCEMIEDPLLVKEMKLLMENEQSLRTLFRINEIIFALCVKWAEHGPIHIEDRLEKSQRYDPIIQYVNNDANATTTVAILADMCGMRSDVFSRAFRKDVGMTPKSFVSNVVLRKASAMLLTPGTSVTSVAEKLEFSSEFYFSHFFKRLTGMSPKEFQKMNGC